MADVPQREDEQAATPPKVDVRTMLSDMQSIQDTGGGLPKPYTPLTSSPFGFPQDAPASSGGQATPPPPSPPPPPFPPTPVPPPPPPFPPPPPIPPIPSMTATPPPPTTPSKPPVKPTKPSGSKKGIFAMLLALLLVVAIGIVVFFFVLPLFKKGEEAATDTQASSETSAVPGEVVPPAVPLVPEGTVSAPEPPAAGSEATTTATSTSEETGQRAEDVRTLSSHASLLKSAAAATVSVALDPKTKTIKDVAQFEAADTALLKEVELKHENGEFLGFSGLASLIDRSSSFWNTTAADLFEDDVTLLLYADNRGAWPVYVFKIKSGVAPETVDAQMKALESLAAADLAKLFLSDPGTNSGWRTGAAGGITTRYTVFSQAGAGLNYGRSGAIFLISTSYAAFKEAANKL